MSRILFLFCLTLSLSLPRAVYANSCATSKKPECVCSQNKPPQSQNLAEVRSAAIAVRVELCANDGTRESVLQSLVLFARETSNWFDVFGGFEHDKKLNDDVLIEYPNSAKEFPNIDDPAEALGRQIMALSFGDVEYIPADVVRCRKQAKNADCEAILREFKDLWNYAQHSYAIFEQVEFAKHAFELSGQWNKYLAASRGMTSIELIFNSWYYEKNSSQHFDAPPAMQFVILHPSLVIENVSAAVDGENTEEALALDIFGVNWWKQDKWYMPSGGAITTLYSDREQVKDWGYGVSLYFRSIYTLGVTDHDGDQGIFVSVDLLKLFQDKKKTLHGYFK